MMEQTDPQKQEITQGIHDGHKPHTLTNNSTVDEKHETPSAR